MGYFFRIETPVAVCVLPYPPIKQDTKEEKSPPVADMYEIDLKKQEFGFHSATAIRRNEGSVYHLTDLDIKELKSRGYWGNEHQKRGRVTNLNNAKAKVAWHDGANAAQIGGIVGLGESWAEKRHSAFEAALKQETSNT